MEETHNNKIDRVKDKTNTTVLSGLSNRKSEVSAADDFKTGLALLQLSSIMGLFEREKNQHSDCSTDSKQKILRRCSNCLVVVLVHYHHQIKASIGPAAAAAE